METRSLKNSPGLLTRQIRFIDNPPLTKPGHRSRTETLGGLLWLPGQEDIPRGRRKKAGGGIQEVGYRRLDTGGRRRQTCFMTAGLDDIGEGQCRGRGDLVHWRKEDLVRGKGEGGGTPAS